MRPFSACLAIALTGACVSAPAPSPDRQPEILLAADGDIGRKLHAAWLSDGRTILFSGLREGTWDLFALTVDGHVRRFAADDGFEGSPAPWPGLGRLAFERFDPRRGRSRMWTMRPDGTDERLLSDHAGFRPEPSPDGRRVAFDNGVQVEPNRVTHQIFVIQGDGSGLTRLTRTDSYEASRSWSPDGSRLAFYSQRDDHDRDFNAAMSEIYVMDADGANARRLTSLGARSQYPTWSPSSNWIAFESNHADNFELYLVAADGRSQPVRLTATPGAERNPSWSRDGKRLLYSYEVDVRAEIRAIRAPAPSRG